jgi:hypothetical protein
MARKIIALVPGLGNELINYIRPGTGATIADSIAKKRR